MRHPENELAELEESSLLRRLPVADSLLENFSSNDYLGLARHPRIVKVYQEALATYGAGSTASRLICGSMPPHAELESLIARAKGMSQVARNAGLSRESLYKAFRPDAKPRFETVTKVLRALKLQLNTTPQSISPTS